MTTTALKLTSLMVTVAASATCAAIIVTASAHRPLAPSTDEVLE